MTGYRVILVSGPQRAGTTIATEAIARTLHYRAVREEEYGTHDVDRWRTLIDAGFHLIIQCPAMSHLLHVVADRDVLVVFMKRDIADIVASQERVNWPALEKRRALGKYNADEGEPAPLKYTFWHDVQRDLIENWIELDYEALSTHPLWVPQAQRRHFGPRQTAL